MYKLQSRGRIRPTVDWPLASRSFVFEKITKYFYLACYVTENKLD